MYSKRFFNTWLVTTVEVAQNTGILVKDQIQTTSWNYKVNFPKYILRHDSE